MSTFENRRNTFAMLEEAAAGRLRCPFNDQIEGGTATVTALAKEGKIRVEVMSQNWRVVHILIDPQAGKCTAYPPGGPSMPYLIVDTNGSRRTDGKRLRAAAGPVTLPFKDGRRTP